jgi:hypothetical protein
MIGIPRIASNTLARRLFREMVSAVVRAVNLTFLSLDNH